MRYILELAFVVFILGMIFYAIPKITEIIAKVKMNADNNKAKIRISENMQEASKILLVDEDLRKDLKGRL
ncbi:MAG: hypothetical protein LC122_11630 [Chitinophagales bacterium]|nr:hypothetical protein [Chitinophagales bacterium]